jgi:hypothetical protein
LSTCEQKSVNLLFVRCAILTMYYSYYCFRKLTQITDNGKTTTERWHYLIAFFQLQLRKTNGKNYEPTTFYFSLLNSLFFSRSTFSINTEMANRSWKFKGVKWQNNFENLQKCYLTIIMLYLTSSVTT